MYRPIRHRLGIWIPVAGALIGMFAAGALAGGSLLNRESNVTPGDRVKARSYTGSRTTLGENLVKYDKTFRIAGGTGNKAYLVKNDKITNKRLGRFDVMRVRCHGGLLRVTWHIGNLEPTVPDTGIGISIYRDGKQLGTLIKGSTRGTFDDGPAEIHAVTHCPRGWQTLWAKVVYVSGGWGIPYSGGSLAVNRGFIAEETWRP